MKSVPIYRTSGGAIPSNLVSIPNTDSNSPYLRLCKECGIERHPARFPVELPSFFIKMLTDPDDLVLDIFGGSNTTGYAAETLNRRWLTFEASHDYLVTSVFRFLERHSRNAIREIVGKLQNDAADLHIGAAEASLF